MQAIRDMEFASVAGVHALAVVSLVAVRPANVFSRAGAARLRQGLPADASDFRIFSASQDLTVRQWDPYDLACVQRMPVGGEPASMCFHQPRGVLVTGHTDGNIRLWNPDTGSAAGLRGHYKSVRAVTTLPNPLFPGEVSTRRIPPSHHPTIPPSHHLPIPPSPHPTISPSHHLPILSTNY